MIKKIYFSSYKDTQRHMIYFCRGLFFYSVRKRVLWSDWKNAILWDKWCLCWLRATKQQQNLFRSGPWTLFYCVVEVITAVCANISGSVWVCVKNGLTFKIWRKNENFSYTIKCWYLIFHLKMRFSLCFLRSPMYYIKTKEISHLICCLHFFR